jgi:hypothetical protein
MGKIKWTSTWTNPYKTGETIVRIHDDWNRDFIFEFRNRHDAAVFLNALRKRVK